MDRRKFLTVSGVSLGAGALYTMAPLLAGNAEGAELARQLGRQNGERPTPFTVFQLSDTHVGWEGALGTTGVRARGGRRQPTRARRRTSSSSRAISPTTPRRPASTRRG